MREHTYRWRGFAGKGPTSFVWFPACCVRPVEENEEPTRHVKYYTRMSESDSNVEISGVNGDAKQ